MNKAFKQFVLSTAGFLACEYCARTAPLAIHLTNGFPGVVTQPYIQVQGYCETQLKDIHYILRTNGVVSERGKGGVRRQHYDRVLGQFTTNWFQVYDLKLVPGTNHLVLQFTNHVGDSTMMELGYHLDYSGVKMAPKILAQWPTNGSVLSGTSFTLRGYVDDPTARIHATITAANGTVAEARAKIERDGLFWVDHLPLGNAASVVTLALTNAAGIGQSQTFTITKSSVQLTINRLSDDELRKPLATVRGTIDTAGYTVWVNGVKAADNGAGTWIAHNVPVARGGTASFQAVAIPNSDNGGNGTPAVVK